MYNKLFKQQIQITTIILTYKTALESPACLRRDFTLRATVFLTVYVKR